MRRRLELSILIVTLTSTACAAPPRVEGFEDTDVAPTPPAADEFDEGESSGDFEEKLDLGGDATGPATCGGSGESSCSCEGLVHTACDGATDDPLAAMGLGCPGDVEVVGNIRGSAEAIGIRSGFGNTDSWAPTEGGAYAVIGSGRVAELDTRAPNGDDRGMPRHCNDDLGSEHDLRSLPMPIYPVDVGNVDCEANPDLVGSGDCSNTLQAEWDAGVAGGGGTCLINGQPCCEVNGEPCSDEGAVANDYAELRFEATVPPNASSFSYDLAFFTTEWPAYHGSAYNDFFVGWLESETWTGNVSFDEEGNPISLNAAFFDYLDHSRDMAEFADTCMRGHGGTKWLTTTAGVTPGERITMVFAIFDLSDSILDSFVFLDNWQWGCDDMLVPTTVPEG